MTMASNWLQCFAPRPQARQRLFCFHHAGVGAAVYRPWGQALPDGIEVQAVQLPGRANRLREPALDRLDVIVDGIVHALQGRLDLPFAFFGHSMGSVIAFETARALAERGAPVPQRLFVSGRRPPHVPDPNPPIAHLDDAGFVDEINRRYGGIPPEILEQADVMALLLPGLRADIRALETHPTHPTVPLEIPVHAYGGTDDRNTPRDHLEAWRQVTRGPFRMRHFPGDHFYLEPQRKALLDDIASALNLVPTSTVPSTVLGVLP